MNPLEHILSVLIASIIFALIAVIWFVVFITVTPVLAGWHCVKKLRGIEE